MSVKGTSENNYEFYDFYKMFDESEDSQVTKTEEIGIIEIEENVKTAEEVKKEESSKELTLYGIAIAEEIDILISEYLPLEDLIKYAQRSKQIYTYYLGKFQIKKNEEIDKIFTLFTFAIEKRINIILESKDLVVDNDDEFTKNFIEYNNSGFKEIIIDKNKYSSFKEVVEKSDEEIFKDVDKLNGSVAGVVLSYINHLKHDPEAIQSFKIEDLYLVEELIVRGVKYYYTERKKRSLPFIENNATPLSADFVVKTLPNLVSIWIQKGNLKEAERITNSDLYIKELEKQPHDQSCDDQITSLAIAYKSKYNKTKDEKFLKKSEELMNRLFNYDRPNWQGLSNSIQSGNPLIDAGSFSNRIYTNLFSSSNFFLTTYNVGKGGPLSYKIDTPILFDQHLFVEIIEKQPKQQVVKLQQEQKVILEEIKMIEKEKQSDDTNNQKPNSGNFLQKITNIGKNFLNYFKPPSKKKEEEQNIKIEKEESGTDTDTSHNSMDAVD